MAIQQVIVWDPTNKCWKQYTALDTSAGAGSAGNLVALNSSGKVDITMMPSGVGADTVTATAGESISAGHFVYLYNNAGTLTVAKANATDATKPAMGYVLSSYSSSDAATVYLAGNNNQIPIGSFVAADRGKPVFLDTTGGLATLTPPAVAGNIVQPLGRINDVGSVVSAEFNYQPYLLLA